MTTPQPERVLYERSWELQDIAIRSGGDGRTVTAYATPFDIETPIRDFQGTYIEKINRSAFNRTLAAGIDRVQVFYNHAKNIGGTASERFSTPIGRPLDIRPDGKGLLTVTRYAKTPNGDEVLQLIAEDMIRGYSFRGPIFDSVQRGIDQKSGLRVVERTELGLVEYGPTPLPAYEDARVLAVRSTDVLDLAELTDEQRAAIAALLEAGEANGTHDEPAAGTSSGPPPIEDTHDEPVSSGPSFELPETEQAARRRRALTPERP